MKNVAISKTNFREKLRINQSAFAAWREFKRVFSFTGIEPIVWSFAFVFFAIHNPYTQSEFSICPLKILGFHYCPGCGLGRSISFLLHGDPVESFRTHVLGIPATITLLIRTLTLLGKSIKRNRQLNLKESPWQTFYS